SAVRPKNRRPPFPANGRAPPHSAIRRFENRYAVYSQIQGHVEVGSIFGILINPLGIAKPLSTEDATETQTDSTQNLIAFTIVKAES
ncbi:hypothetical protein J437_LFUL012090, partial [Ladona fulva]